jgi:hypothetical protein
MYEHRARQRDADVGPYALELCMAFLELIV